ncbi:hypothetical protein [Acinetobacter brisouii]|uniref:Uncharacterized protein n=1 Tax=Acinetobacter brisouii CIP 110357 TaxID=1341683 RepID=V2VVN6_9GAMM|nr:hypothetical protein [Acinetobacter brisouii]ENV48327.1 hypothetical protein F954_01395 [Acinetobacter brisouii ANC 4119]ESK51779.1 hypothetical protein P255_01208 [Acinetobacter brisouii CIP 110357]KJV38532.1 hypothetical protein VH98_09335 [Acinetobacter brisouii]
MNKILIELIQPIKHEKQGYEPKLYNEGTLLKVVHEAHDAYLVRADDEFSFSVRKSDENVTWVKI